MVENELGVLNVFKMWNPKGKPIAQRRPTATLVEEEEWSPCALTTSPTLQDAVVVWIVWCDITKTSSPSPSLSAWWQNYF